MNRRSSTLRSVTSTSDMEMIPFVGFFIRLWHVVEAMMPNGRKEEEEEGKEVEMKENEEGEGIIHDFEDPGDFSEQASGFSYSPSSRTTTPTSTTHIMSASQPTNQLEPNLEGEEEEEEEMETPAVNVVHKHTFFVEEGSSPQSIALELSRLDDNDQQL